MNNRISGNGADTDDAATPGPTGINVFGLVSITGTLITGNVIEDEADDPYYEDPCSYVKDFDQSQSMRFEVDYVLEGDCFLRRNHCRSL
jgi:hypothetical protein